MRHVLMLAVLALSWTQAQAAVVTKTVEYRQGDTTLQGYMAWDDATDAKRPGVLVVHEWWGLNDYAKQRARQLAELGYVAFAIDMYGEGRSTTDREQAAAWAGHLHGSPVMRERAKAGYQVLADNPLVDPERIGAIGFCFGGTTVLELAYAGVDLAGVVTFHGGLVAPKPEDMDRIKAKFLILHGAEDGFVSPEAMQAFQDGMREAGADWQMVLYGGAVHSFSNPMADQAGIQGVAYNERAARRSWQAMQDFFREVLQP